MSTMVYIRIHIVRVVHRLKVFRFYTWGIWLDMVVVKGRICKFCRPTNVISSLKGGPKYSIPPTSHSSMN